MESNPENNKVTIDGINSQIDLVTCRYLSTIEEDLVFRYSL